MIRTKICSRCGKEKPITAFHWRDDSPDGHRGVCKDCINARLRIARWKKAHPTELVRVEPPKELWVTIWEHNRHEPEPAPEPLSPLGHIIASIRRSLGL